jgi:predicted DNA-binding transcriptional regulator AlpA
MSEQQGKSDCSEREYLDQLLTEREAAKFLGYSQKALQKWRCEGGGPAFVRARRSIRYRRRDLLAWAESLVRVSTSDPGR